MHLLTALLKCRFMASLAPEARKGLFLPSLQQLNVQHIFMQFFYVAFFRCHLISFSRLLSPSFTKHIELRGRFRMGD